MLLSSAGTFGVKKGFRISSVTGNNATFSNSNCVNNFPFVQVDAAGGVEPYSFNWTKISGDGSIFSQSSTSGNLEVQFTSVCPQQTKSGVYRITVTDNTAATVSKDVTVQTTNTF